MPVRLVIALCASLLLGSQVSAQQAAPKTSPASGRIYLDVVVQPHPKSGAPVAGLQQQDFTLLDNKSRQPLTSFQALGGKQAPVGVILLVDAVNASFQGVAYERGQIDRFLHANGGHLAHPTALAVLTDKGIQLQQGFSSDGNALSASLDEYTIGLRTIRRSEGFYGAAERFDLSLVALHQLATRAAALPERKIVLWISPGWPLLSGPGVQLESKQQQQLFGDIVSMSTQLRQARTTLYSIDPIGAGESVLRNTYYEEFVKGISRPDQVDAGDLGLQVLATQSGGLALHSSNDIAAQLQTCLDDAEAYYELSFDPPPAEHPDEYHHLEVQIARPGLVGRTRTGYYARH